MGLGFGGEWAAGAVLLGETIRAQHRGKASREPCRWVMQLVGRWLYSSVG